MNPPSSKSTDAPASKRGSVRRVADKFATGLITVGGAGVIAVVVAIFVFIAFETLPLWIPPSVEVTSSLQIPDSLGRLLVAGEDEYRNVGFGVTDRGYAIGFVAATGELLASTIPGTGEGGRVTAAYYHEAQSLLSWGNEQGILSAATVTVGSGQPDSKPLITFTDLGTITLGGNQSVRKLVGKMSRSSDLVFVALSDSSGRQLLHHVVVRQRENRFTGETTREETRSSMDAPEEDSVVSLAVDMQGTKILLGLSDGSIQYWTTRNGQVPTLVQSVKFSDDTPITALEVLLGGQSLLAGSSRGEVRSFTWINDTLSLSSHKLIPLNQFEHHTSSVTSFSTSSRNKSFLSVSEGGELFLHYQTSGKTLSRMSVGAALRHVSFAPKSNGAISVTQDGRVVSIAIDNPHPEVSLGVLFGKVQYEGYAEPGYTWQSSSGTDDFEPKLSLMPLLMGTLKGAFYALIFALPIALLAAIYTALFAHPKIKNIVKPTVEIMAALPSVVIGFIAALWLAPILEKSIVDVAFMVITIPFFVFLAALTWQLIPKRWTNRLPQGSEVFLIIPSLLLMGYVGLKMGPSVETLLFAGNFKQWLYETLNVTYDQRNSLVVGFAMGFAVIPIIFTISEDSLSSVPEHLTAGSLALGATRWQTAIKVVLPTASPGIFSAAMVGFGRAVGETMIVLMATGNTPLMDFSPFLGMRTLSANIAVEIPEAPYLGTLYRVLFVSGILLFFFTFVVNTLAEIIRQRLRKQYSTI